MKEMLTCANFLRENSPEVLYEIISKGYKKDDPPLLEILCGDEPEGEPCCIGDNKKPTNNCSHTENEYKNKLEIRLYLRKPKDLAVAVEEIQKEDIKNDNFEIEKVELPKDDKNEFSCLEKEISHRILLVEKSELVDKPEYNKKFYEDDQKAPCRIMEYDNTKTIDDKYYLGLYEKYIKDELCGNEKPLPLIINNIGSEYFFYDIEDLSIRLNINNKYEIYTMGKKSVPPA
ncbi:MAG: hypothetical protein MRJ65_05965 [Candidatus Brocadiaceae bacterium]|nr:hypothetical protein [Candidatus Brocadiaceae bacterium]